MTGLILHGYWRSSAAYRVRIALELKGIRYEQVTHDLRADAQHEAQFLELAPQGLVPALETTEGVVTQSPAVLEWLEETYPTPALLPLDPFERAQVRAMAALIGCDIHPLNNLRVLNRLKNTNHLDPREVTEWISHWIAEGFTALEQMVIRHGGAFCFGSSPTLADCYLIPQVYSARRFGVDLSSYPHLVAVAERAEALPAFLAAHPSVQPDADD